MNMTPTESDESTQLAPTSGKTKVLNLDYKVAGLLCYLPICAVNLVTSIVVMKTEPKSNRFLRFHAAQSIVLSLGVIALGLVVGIVSMVFGALPFLGPVVGLLNLAWLLVTLAYIYICIVGMLAAHRGSVTKLPLIGDIAARYL